ncbi:MAG: ATP cone domain-containing protein [Candidatus Nanoarchaeia archaeon]|nr:ATP cone domain-containing protein [Candidatus Nanoarchaeia archaeon]
MVQVIKKSKKKEAFKPAKIVRACKRSGCPEPIAKTIASEVSKKLKGRKIVTSTAIKQMVFSMLMKVEKVRKSWMMFEQRKRAKKKPMKAKAKKKKR